MVRCGWYDIFALANGNIYPELRRRLTSPVHLILGPWTHNACERTYAGDVDFGEDAALRDYNERRLVWFDRWLRSPPLPLREGP